MCDSGRSEHGRAPRRSLHLQARYQPGNVYVCLPVVQEVGACGIFQVALCPMCGVGSPLKGPDTLVMPVPPLRAPGR